MIELVMHTVKNDMVIHTEKTRMMRLVVEIDVDGMIDYVIDKSASIASVADNSEYFFSMVTPFSSTVGQRSGKFSMDSSIVRPCCLFNIYSSILLFHESYMSFSNIGGRLSAPERIALSSRLVILKFMMLKIT
uniref:Uncharacterized protein n=1 Tax=Tanacetum cinerariifolium TaxID=118510 RepID=A0A699H5P3_TANCI|nr:hypothetical protein [Tanacetum cinerariifolium]